jgi:hypothetical protein
MLRLFRVTAPPLTVTESGRGRTALRRTDPGPTGRRRGQAQAGGLGARGPLAARRPAAVAAPRLSGSAQLHSAGQACHCRTMPRQQPALPVVCGGTVAARPGGLAQWHTAKFELRSADRRGPPASPP